MKAKAEAIRPEPAANHDEFVRLFERAAEGCIAPYVGRLIPFLEAVKVQDYATSMQRKILSPDEGSAFDIFCYEFRDVLEMAPTIRPDLRAALTPILQDIVNDTEKAERSEVEYVRRSKAATKGWEGRRRRAGARSSG